MEQMTPFLADDRARALRRDATLVRAGRQHRHGLRRFLLSRR
jgi:hypothetical protein